VNSTRYGTPDYAMFSSLLPLPPTYFQIFSSEPCVQTFSMRVLLSMWETNFLGRSKESVQIQDPA